MERIGPWQGAWISVLLRIQELLSHPHGAACHHCQLWWDAMADSTEQGEVVSKFCHNVLQTHVHSIKTEVEQISRCEHPFCRLTWLNAYTCCLCQLSKPAGRGESCGSCCRWQGILPKRSDLREGVSPTPSHMRWETLQPDSRQAPQGLSQEGAGIFWPSPLEA